MSQVKNLRAMFEQKGDSSPPDRGREGLPTTPADSPRPLSRVRTSFVTVEKDGRVGLQRDTSSDSIPTLSRTLSAVSAGTESDAAGVSAAPLSPARSRSPVKLDDAKSTPIAQTPKRLPAPIPEESAPVTPTKATLPVSPAKPPQEATPKRQPPAEVTVSAPTPERKDKEKTEKSPIKTLDTKAIQRDKSPTPSPRKLFAKPASNTESEPAASTPKKTLEAPASAPAANGAKKANDAPKNGTASQPAAPAAARPNGVTNGASKDAPSKSRTTAATSSIPLRPKAAGTGPTSKESHKPIAANAGKSAPKAISTVRANAKPSVKSPSIAKTPTTKTPTSPNKPAVPKAANTKPASKTTDRKTRDTATEKSITAAAPKLTAGKASGSTTKKPAAIQTFPSNGIGFVKPKPKSPTRPVHLPSSLTTHTASSATKAGVPRQSLSRQSGNFLTLHQPSSSSAAGAVRSPSRTSISSTSAPRTLRRQSSNVSRPRPSIGPPPKQTARDHPVTKKEKEVDEGFLARMMRPTQASALKTADKAHIASPPRKQPVTVGVAAVSSAPKAARKSVAPRENLAVTSKKDIPKPTIIGNPPNPCIMRNPNIPLPTTEKAAVADEAVQTAKEAEPTPEVAVPAEEEPAEQAVSEASEEPVEEETVEEEAVEEPVDEAADEDVPAIVETPAGEEEEKEESHIESVVESVEEPKEVEEEVMDEPSSEAAAEEEETSIAEEAASPIAEAEASEEEADTGAEVALEDSDTSAVEASVADSDIPEAGH